MAMILQSREALQITDLMTPSGDEESVRRHQERRQLRIDWLRDPSHHTKRRVLREYLAGVFEKPDETSRIHAAAKLFGGFALVQQDIAKPTCSKIESCNLTNPEDCAVDEGLVSLFDGVPNIVFPANADLATTYSQRHLFIPNGDCSFDVLRVSRVVTERPDEPVTSHYSLASELLVVK